MALTKEEKVLRAKHRRSEKWRKQHKLINGMDNKICNKCNNYFPATLEFFYPNKSNNIDGLYPYCISCSIKKAAEFNEQNKDHVIKVKSDWHKKNKDKNNTRDSLWYKKNKEQKREYLRKWQQENKSKLYDYGILHRNHDITESEWASCKHYFNYECAYCGMDEDIHIEILGKQLHQEHVNHEGANDITNCVPSCQSCNSSKRQKVFEEWYSEENPVYSKRKLNKIYKWINTECLNV